MTILLLSLFSVVTFGLLPLAVYAAAARLMAPREHERIPLFLLTAPLAPLVLGLLLMALYSGPMRPSPRVVIVIVFAALAAALYYGSGEISLLLKKLRAEAKRFRVEWSGTDLLLYFLLALAVLQIATLPLMENDAIEYAAVARHIFEARSLGVYPVLEAAPNGLFAPSSHPPAYHMYLVWGYVWMGVENFAPARLLALFCMCGMASLLALALYEHERRTKVIAMILMLSVPLFTSMLVGYHIDALRLVSFLAAAIAVAGVVDRPSTRQAVLTGAVLGLAAFTHSVGLLAWVFAGLAWLILGPPDRFRNFRLPLIIGAVAIAVGGAQFVKNLVIYGVPLQDSAPIWEMPQLGFSEDLRYRRDLMGRYDRVVFGILRGFVEFPLFGVLFWLALPAAWRVWRRWRLASPIEQVAVIWAVAFFAIAIASVLAGTELVVKNARYVLTLAPLFVVISSPMLALWPHEGRWARRAVVGAMCVMSGWVVLQSMVRTANFGARIDLWANGERAPIYRANNRFPGAPLYRYIEQNLKPGEKTLVFRQADFTLHGKGPWLDNFDTALEPLYNLESVGEAHAWLRAHNVRFVLVPDYTFPTYYRTVVGRLLADQRYVEAISGHRGFKLFELREAPIAANCTSIPQAEQRLVTWLEKGGWLLTLSRVSGLPFLSFADAEPMGALRFESPGVGNWEAVASGATRVGLTTEYGRRVRLVSGAGPVALPPTEPWAQLDGSGDVLRISLDARGLGMYAIDVVEFFERPSSHVAISTRVWDGVLQTTSRKIELQYKPQQQAKSFRLVVSNVGRAPAAVEIGNWELCRKQPRQPAEAQIIATRSMNEKQGEMRASWPAAHFNANCRFNTDDACSVRHVDTHVRETSPRGDRLLGEIGVVKTTDFTDGLWARIAFLLESWRIALEREPDSTINQVMQPIQQWLTGGPKASEFAHYSLSMTVAGNGEYSVYVQYTLPSGETRWRHAGHIFLPELKSEYALRMLLPVEAGKFEMALIGKATNLFIGDANLLRLSGR
jgi:hypothetical protein